MTAPVALESTVITHGLPRPVNLETPWPFPPSGRKILPNQTSYRPMKLLTIVILVFSSLISAQRPSFSGAGNRPDFGIPDSQSNTHTRMRLVAGPRTFVPGRTVTLGVVLEMDPHWHTYWINPGDSGMPTQVDLEMPEGFEAGEIQWPVPKRLMLEGLVTLGYEDKAILRIPVKTPENLELGREVEIRAEVSWLECRDVCLPGDGSSSIVLIAAEQAGAIDGELLESRGNLPETSDWPASYRVTSKGAVLRVEAPAGTGLFTSFFPLAEGEWELEPEPEVAYQDNLVEVRLVRNETAGPLEGGPIRGLLVTEDGRGFQVEAAPAASGGAEKGNPSKPLNVLLNLGLAFVAGIGMNLLPCIFPVLGLKISGFIEQAQGDRKILRAHALVFGAGVVISLWILGAGVGLLGAAWGAQFQDPRVVIGLLLVLTFFSMNLFGVFEMGNSLTTVGGDLGRRQGYAGSFFQGVLLTVIGTPCTGPILAVVIVWMLTQPLWIGFLAFTFMGVGIALPYVALAFSPKLIDRLPRPGNWMVTFKQGSAFMLVLFMWVMLYVLKGQLPADGVVRVVGAMLILCLAAWVLGTWDAPGRRPEVRLRGRIACGLLIAAAAWAAYSYREPAEALTPELEARIESGDPILWSELTPELGRGLMERGVPVHYRPWTPEAVEDLRRAGRPVFVDFTADWCTICKINKVRALHREEVLRAFEKKGVATLRADWTARNPEIAEVLESYGRRGVPVYLLFDAEPDTRAELLPETLTPEVVIQALDELPDPPDSRYDSG